jgi:TetR/AcrR family acrAB operon transcriptional repressor
METRRRLLDSALDVMSEKPFSNVSMNDIAEGVGLSKGAVYWHFKNKNDVLVSLLEVICEYMEQDFYQIGALPDGFSGLRGFFKKKLAGADGERARKIKMLTHRMHEWPEEVARIMTDSMRDMARRELEMVSELVRRAQTAREIRSDIPPGDIAGLLSAIFYGMVFLQIHGLYRMDFSKYADSIFSALEKEFALGDNIVPMCEDTKQCDLKETV